MKTATEILKECTGHAHGLTDAMHIQAMHLYAIEKVKDALKLAARNAKVKATKGDRVEVMKSVNPHFDGWEVSADSESILSLETELIENIKKEK